MASEGKLKTVLVNNTIKPILNYTARSNVYQETNNQLGPLEDVQFANDTEISFNICAWGSTGVAKISNNYEFIKNLWLRVELSVDGTEKIGKVVNRVRGKTSLLGWGLIDTLYIRIPGMPQLVYDGRLLPYRFFEDCESMEKRRELVNLVGYCEANHNKDKRYLFVPIPLPGTDIKGSNVGQSKPFPTHLLNSALEIAIKWARKVDVVDDNARWDIRHASLVFQYLTLGTPAQLKKALYRYQYLQNYDYEYTVSGLQNSITLMGLNAGETRELLVVFLPKIADVPNQPYTTCLPYGLKLEFNGQLLWNGGYNGNYQFQNKTETVVKPGDTLDPRVKFYDIVTSNLPSYWEDFGYYEMPTNEKLPDDGEGDGHLFWSGMTYTEDNGKKLDEKAERVKYEVDILLKDLLFYWGYHEEAISFNPPSSSYPGVGLFSDEYDADNEPKIKMALSKMLCKAMNIPYRDIWSARRFLIPSKVNPEPTILEEGENGEGSEEDPEPGEGDPEPGEGDPEPGEGDPEPGEEDPVPEPQAEEVDDTQRAAFLHRLRLYGTQSIPRRNYWVRIPIAQLLERQQNRGDYSLGVDFAHSDLKLSWTNRAIMSGNPDRPDYATLKPVNKVLVQANIQSVMSFDGGVAKLIQ